MVELVLVLQLLGTPPPARPVQLVLVLSGAGGERAGAPAFADGARDLAPAPPGLAPIPELGRGAGQRRPIRLGTVAASGVGVVVGDVVSAIPFAVGLLMCVEDLTSYGQTGGCAGGVTLIGVGVVAFVVVPPAAGVLGARAAGERGDAWWRAYGLGLLARLGGFALVTALPAGVQLPALAATELVLTPYVIARVLAGAPLLADAEAPAAGAVPVRDPAAAPSR